MSVIRKRLGSIYKSVISLYGNVIYLLHHKKYQPILDYYHDKYKGQSCFVIGNGPSLRAEDLQLLQNKGVVSFAANRIYNIFEETTWRPTFVSIDDDRFSKDKEVLQNLKNAGQEMTFSASHYGARLDILKPKLCLVKTRWNRKYLQKPVFSLNVSDEIYSIATVTYFNMQLAYHMGFRKIYLLGVDNKYRYERQNDGSIIENHGMSYFNKKTEEETVKTVVNISEAGIAYMSALKASRENGFEIINASRGGKLDVFLKADFDEIINNWE